MAPYRPVLRKQTDAKAVISLFLGLASFVLGPATGIPAIILGSISRRDIDQSRGRYTGTIIARTGTLAGFFGVGFSVVFALWLGSGLLPPASEMARSNVSEQAQQAHAQAAVVKPTPVAMHPRGDVEAVHSIR